MVFIWQHNAGLSDSCFSLPSSPPSSDLQWRTSLWCGLCSCRWLRCLQQVQLSLRWQEWPSRWGFFRHCCSAIYSVSTSTSVSALQTPAYRLYTRFCDSARFRGNSHKISRFLFTAYVIAVKVIPILALYNNNLKNAVCNCKTQIRPSWTLSSEGKRLFRLSTK